MSIKILILGLLLFSASPAFAAPPDHCSADGAIYAPQGRFGDRKYELQLEDLHPTTPGGAYVRLHLNLYDLRTSRLVTTAAMTEACVGTGLCECRVHMHGLRQPIDIMLLDKDLHETGGDLLGAAPYAILLPHIHERFYYGVHVEDKNPDVQYFSDPQAMIALDRKSVV